MAEPAEKVAPVDYCENCFYFFSDSTTDTVSGICRRYPPAMSFALTPNQPDLKPWWPQVQGKDWCGEHRNLIT